MSVLNNPPAFPIADVRTHDGFGISEGSPGMTLRDWFAGQALTAVITATSAGQHQPKRRAGEGSHAGGMARDAYEMADAMLAARGAA